MPKSKTLRPQFRHTRFARSCLRPPIVGCTLLTAGVLQVHVLQLHGTVRAAPAQGPEQAARRTLTRRQSTEKPQRFEAAIRISEGHGDLAADQAVGTRGKI